MSNVRLTSSGSRARIRAEDELNPLPPPVIAADANCGGGHDAAEGFGVLLGELLDDGEGARGIGLLKERGVDARLLVLAAERPGSDIDMTLNSSAFQHLQNSVELLMAEGVYPPGDPTTAALQLLTAAHGVAALLISKPYLPWGDVKEFADQALSAACLGHVVLGLVKDDDAIVQLANDSHFGLSGVVFSQNIERAKSLASRIETGAVWINTFASTAPELPFGGVKRSGYGRELSELGIKEFVNQKLVLVKQ